MVSLMPVVEREWPADLDALVAEQLRSEGRGKPLKPIEHGTRYGYSRGCRCAECRRAMRDSCRAWRKDQAEKKVTGETR
jgi:hypothetical protein